MKIDLKDLTTLIQMLEVLPAKLQKFSYNPDTFGNWYIVIRYLGQMYEITYDGRDETFSIQVSKKNLDPKLLWSENSVDEWQQKIVMLLKQEAKHI